MTDDPRNESQISPQTLSLSGKPDTDLAMPQEPRQSAPNNDQLQGSASGNLTRKQHCNVATGTDIPLGTSKRATVHEIATAPADLHTPPVNAIKFSTDDLPMISQLMDLKVIRSQQDHEGSHCLYLLEQLMFLDSLTSVEPPAMKRRCMRNQHFWRDSAKLSVRERVYVQSAAVQLALEEGLPVTSCTHLDKEQHTSTWTVCLTAFGCKELLNRRVSPLGVRLFRALMLQSDCPVKV